MNEIENGDVLFYDNVLQTLIEAENSECNFYDKERFKPIGIVVAVSKDRSTIKVVSPEFINMHIDVQRKETERDLMKFVNNMLTDKRFHYSEDIKYYIPDEEDFTLISDNAESVLYGLSLYSAVMQANGSAKLDYIITNEIIGFFGNDKKNMRLMFCGIGPDLNAKYLKQSDYEDFETYPDEISVGWSPYTDESYDDYMKRQAKETTGIVKYSEETYGNKPKETEQKETYSMIYTYSEIKQCFERLDLLEFYVVPFAVIKIE